MKKNYLIFMLLIFATPLVASQVAHISNQELKNLMEQGVPVVDVRSTSEWYETGMIENSHLLMFFDETGKYNLNAWLKEVAKLADKHEPVILICHSGGRSDQLAKYLTQVAGYKEVYNLKYGIVDWIKQNNSVVAPN